MDSYILKLRTLRCEYPDDYDGKDECRLVVIPNNDDRKSVVMDFTLGKGQDKTLNWKHEFSTSIEVVLWDLDNPPLNPHDKLGEITIRPEVAMNRNIVWGVPETRGIGGWHTYTLIYDVTRVE